MQRIPNALATFDLEDLPRHHAGEQPVAGGQFRERASLNHPPGAESEPCRR
jgi:hypothetical protein